MSIPDLPLPEPGDIGWAGPLNESLELLNDAVNELNVRVATVDVDAAEQALTEAQAAVDYAMEHSVPGPTGPTGPQGQGIELAGVVPNYSDLPSGLGSGDAGKAYLVEEDGKLYVWSGTSFPADGDGSDLRGPEGPQGPPGEFNPNSPVARIWTGTEYPARLPGYMNIFVGPVAPGIAMDPATDLWAGPEFTTIPTLISQLSDSGSAFYGAVRAASVPSRIWVDASVLHPTDDRPPTFGSSVTGNSSSSVAGWKMPPASTTVLGCVVDTPLGWSSAQIRLVWTPLTAQSGAVVSLACRSFRIEDEGVITNTGTVLTTTSNLPSVGSTRHTLFTPGATVISNGRLVKVNLLRQSSGDTFNGTILILGFWLERLS